MREWLLVFLALPTFTTAIAESLAGNSTELIVMLNGYYDAGTRRTLLFDLGAGPLSFLPSTTSLSDFQLVEVPSSSVDSTIARLSRLPNVRYVSLQQAVRRPLYSEAKAGHRKLQGLLPQQITTLLRAPALWELGYYGDGVKVAILDTGLPMGHPHFKYVAERTDWTDERSSDDGLGHGTFVAGVIASSKECLGFAPHAQLHVYKVFTSHQVNDSVLLSTSHLLGELVAGYIEATVRLYEIPEDHRQFDILLGLDWWSQMGNPTLDLERETLTLPGWPDLPLRLIPFQPALYNPGPAEFDLPDRGYRAVRFWQRLRVDPGPPEEPGRGRDHSQLLPFTASGTYGNGTGTSRNGRDSGGQARDGYGGDRGGRGRCGRRPNNASH